MRLIDAKKFREEMSKYIDRYGYVSCTITKLNIALERSESDAVEVVRCKDCESWDNGMCRRHSNSICAEPNDYCSWGEREEDE